MIGPRVIPVSNVRLVSPLLLFIFASKLERTAEDLEMYGLDYGLNKHAWPTPPEFLALNPSLYDWQDDPEINKRNIAQEIITRTAGVPILGYFSVTLTQAIDAGGDPFASLRKILPNVDREVPATFLKPNECARVAAKIVEDLQDAVVHPDWHRVRNPSTSLPCLYDFCDDDMELCLLEISQEIADMNGYECYVWNSFDAMHIFRDIQRPTGEYALEETMAGPPATVFGRPVQRGNEAGSTRSRYIAASVAARWDW